jgi:hypothetical protein
MNRRTFFSLTAIALASSLAACGSTSTPTEAASKRHEIDAAVDGALNKLYSATPGAREQGSKAKGILVFPSVIAAGLVVGGEYGEGALRAGGTSIGYYKTSTASSACRSAPVQGGGPDVHDPGRARQIPDERQGLDSRRGWLGSGGEVGRQRYARHRDDECTRRRFRFDELRPDGQS